MIFAYIRIKNEQKERKRLQNLYGHSGMAPFEPN
jgi:hypothetical protein